MSVGRHQSLFLEPQKPGAHVEFHFFLEVPGKLHCDEWTYMSLMMKCSSFGLAGFRELRTEKTSSQLEKSKDVELL